MKIVAEFSNCIRIEIEDDDAESCTVALMNAINQLQQDGTDVSFEADFDLPPIDPSNVH